MAKKVAILLATGYEEGESLFLLDTLRRGGLQAELVSTTGEDWVTGSHGITTRVDRQLDDSLSDFDMIILPGGLPGATNLRDDERVTGWVRRFDSEDKWIGAICAAPMVLQKAGITKGRTLTSYPGDKYRKLFVDSDYREDIVVIDGHLLTSRGPATTLPFAYAIIDALGGDSAPLKEGMLYHMAKASTL